MEYYYKTKWTVKSIENGFKGIVVDTTSTSRSFIFKVKTANNDTITVSNSTLNMAFYQEISLNRYIYKVENENYVYLENENGDTLKMYYQRISRNARSNYFFPEIWRDKWVESSEWDN